MEKVELEAIFSQFDLPPTVESRNATVAIPVSDGMQQRYFFFNLKTRKCLTVKYPKRPGLLTKDGIKFLHHLCSFAVVKTDKYFPKLRTMFRRYHNGISFLEVLYKVSKPHGITYVGDQKFLVSLWSSSTYFVIDLKKNTIHLHMLDKKRDEVFSTYQYFDVEQKETYFATQTGDDEFYKHSEEAIDFDVPIVIKTYNWLTEKVKELWRGNFDTDTHYLALNTDKTLLGLVQFGDFFKKQGVFEENNLLPSKILVLDLKTRKEWWIDNKGWSPSAHITWDPIEPDVCYLSCHRGVIVPVDNLFRFFLQKVYKWIMFGPASVHKYRITPEGPEKVGVFTHPEVYRLTIHMVFMHRDKKVLACTGFPNFIFFADADTMEFTEKITIQESCGSNSVVGSLYPSPDGEKVFLITTRSFQIIDVATLTIDHIEDLGKIYDPFNHMISVSDCEW